MALTADDFTELYDRHGRALVIFFQRRTYDPEAAVDLMAETFAVAFRDRRADGAANLRRPSREMVLSMHLRDGSTRTERIPLSF
jgi:DNA-directed RNA polymerase specialized sigma24 family protein